VSASQDAPEAGRPGAWRRFLDRLPDRRRSKASRTGRPLRIYQFSLADDLLRGWQTHVVRQREIHEESARRIQRLHYVVGVLAAISASLAGSSAVAAWQRPGTNAGLAGASVAIAAVAAVLTGVVTFLDFGGRAERHRKAAVEYKKALRRFELYPPFGATQVAGLPEKDRAFFNEMRRTLADIDASAPIPPRRIAKRIEERGQVVRESVFGD
jgi:hypothetical protein